MHPAKLEEVGVGGEEETRTFSYASVRRASNVPARNLLEKEAQGGSGGVCAQHSIDLAVAVMGL